MKFILLQFVYLYDMNYVRRISESYTRVFNLRYARERRYSVVLFGKDHCGAGGNVELQPTLVVAGEQGVVVGEVANGIIIEPMTAEFDGVGVQQHLIGTLTHHEAVACVAAIVAEVEDEEEFAALIGQHLIAVVRPNFGDGCLLDILLQLQDFQHLAVEVSEVVVAELLVVDEVPLTAGVLVAPSVFLSREVDPLGMTELITHEVEISAVDGAGSEQTNHLVESNTALR